MAALENASAEGFGLTDALSTILNASTAGVTYSGPINSVDRLIGKKGGVITLTRESDGTFDPVTQNRTPANTSETFKAVVLPPGKSAEFQVGSLVNRNLIELHVAMKGKSITPQNGDVVRWQNYDWRIIWTSVYDPSGAAPIYVKAYAER